MKIAIWGCGNMGFTYAKAFLRDKIVSKDTLFLIEKAEFVQDKLRESGVVMSEVDERIADCDAIILAVKPQDAHSVYAVLKNILKPSQLVLSIMAGITIEVLKKNLNHENIVRAMPNTPAQIGIGIAGYSTSSNTSTENTELAQKLLSATGKTVFLETESKLDAVTALSGSGPAYFYYIVDAMIKAGIELGIDEHTSALLVKETMNGSYHLMQNSDKSLQELIAAVKSKGGTTEAALNVFAENAIDQKIQKAIFAAESRAKELSKI